MWTLGFGKIEAEIFVLFVLWIERKWEPRGIPSWSLRHFEHLHESFLPKHEEEHLSLHFACDSNTGKVETHKKKSLHTAHKNHLKSTLTAAASWTRESRSKAPVSNMSAVVVFKTCMLIACLHTIFTIGRRSAGMKEQTRRTPRTATMTRTVMTCCFVMPPVFACVSLCASRSTGLHDTNKWNVCLYILCTHARREMHAGYCQVCGMHSNRNRDACIRVKRAGTASEQTSLRHSTACILVRSIDYKY